MKFIAISSLLLSVATMAMALSSTVIQCSEDLTPVVECGRSIQERFDIPEDSFLLIDSRNGIVYAKCLTCDELAADFKEIPQCDKCVIASCNQNLKYYQTLFEISRYKNRK